MERGPIERQIGRIMGKNSRAAGAFVVEVVEDDTASAGLKLQWSKSAQWNEWSQYSEGCYVLRTNVRDWSTEDLWRAYIQLTDAEAASRIHKTEQPSYRYGPSGISVQIASRPTFSYVFLAYVMWKTLEQWQKRAGLGNSPRTILDELAMIQAADANPSRELKLRCVVRPDKSQAAQIDRLGLRLPKRLRANM